MRAYCSVPDCYAPKSKYQLFHIPFNKETSLEWRRLVGSREEADKWHNAMVCEQVRIQTMASFKRHGKIWFSRNKSLAFFLAKLYFLKTSWVSFHEHSWLQTKMRTISGTIFWHSISCSSPISWVFLGRKLQTKWIGTSFEPFSLFDCRWKKQVS